MRIGTSHFFGDAPFDVDLLIKRITKVEYMTSCIKY